MSSTRLTNGSALPNGNGSVQVDKTEDELLQLNLELKNLRKEGTYAKFHGDELIGDKHAAKGFIANLKNSTDDFQRILTGKNIPAIMKVAGKAATGGGLDMKSGASLVAAMSNDSNRRRGLIESQVKGKYDKMLHPPLTYLGDAFQYRTADGKFNNVMSPHLGQAGAPYAKTVPSKTHQLGALPDPGDLFDRLMARQEGGRPSQSGLSSMLVYHATIIIHDIFRTNDNDKNISDSSSYLDLSPLYGYTMEMQRKIRDDRYKLGLLKPDTFAEDRLLRQPPGVCIMLVMYNRYHNYAASQLRRINENGRFSVPKAYDGTLLESVARYYYGRQNDAEFNEACKQYEKAWKAFLARQPGTNPKRLEKIKSEIAGIRAKKQDARKEKEQIDDALRGIDNEDVQQEIKDIREAEWQRQKDNKEIIDALIAKGIGADELKTKINEIRGKDKKIQKDITDQINAALERALGVGEIREVIKQIRKDNTLSEDQKREKIDDAMRKADKLNFSEEHAELERLEQMLEGYIAKGNSLSKQPRAQFEASYRAAWDKLDDDLFNTARLITCGMYIQVAIHDYLRALMGFHQWNTNFTLDPRLDIDHHNVSRGIGNQVTVEFNLLYRFHCAISVHDEEYTKKFMQKTLGVKDPDKLTLEDFINVMKDAEIYNARKGPTEPCDITFGIPSEPGLNFVRNPITGLFDDQDMINALTRAMDDPISNFGPRNVPKCLKPVEIMGIVQARKWEIGTLNDFRDFFGMPRHQTFESVSGNVEIQNALRDLYEHPDKIELYPGVFCESDADMGLDPGPSDVDSALWSAIFSDAITLVRSDRFYTTDWNTNSLTSWGMKEVTPDNDTCKSSVFHRLLQRAFPEWYPYNSVQFFHPFYTRQTNAKFAAEQGYASEFGMSPKPTTTDEYGTPLFDVSKSVPEKPWKPVYLNDVEKIRIVLKDTKNFIHPALKNPENFPPAFKGLFKLDNSKPKPYLPAIKEEPGKISQYFTDLIRYIIKRESISMNSSTLQIDATRDFAIPVVTKYVADFLGFGNLIRSADHPKAPHSENDIYQHIENCHVFLSYNADETKLLPRRKAFKKSMEVLHGLVLGGNIGEANRSWFSKPFGAAKGNSMNQLGLEVAKRVLVHVPDATTAASIMVFVGLHSAYNSVLAFTSALNKFLQEMYDFANPHKNPYGKHTETPRWLRVQELAFQSGEKSEKELRQIVEDAERKSIKLPLLRTTLADLTFKTSDDKEWKVKTGDKVILDIFEANKAVYKNAKDNGTEPQPTDFLMHKSTATDGFADYHPQHIADVGIVAMIKVFAQMRDARRGHDAQGRLKKVKLDSSSEGYTNYMAPMRIQRIRNQVRMLEDPEIAKNVFTDRILRPSTETYLTAEWDEMVPFPNTWKIRFDGFGKSTYATKDTNGNSIPFGKLYEPSIPDDAPPFYQPRGASHTGGTFGDVACVCSAAPVAKVEEGKDKPAKTPAELATTIASGCGLAGH